MAFVDFRAGPIPESPGDPGAGRDWLHDRRLTRRRFLAVSGALLATGLLAACMDDDEDNESGDDATPTLVGATRTPESAIETPQVDASPAGSPTADAAADADLQRFMVLSSALTGFDDLTDTGLGQVYLDAVTGQDDLSDQLDQLYEKVGMSDSTTAVTLEELDSAGAFEDDTRQVADAITAAWYTGTYDSGGGELVVATYINALAWQATDYRQIGPSSCSGQTGNWSAAAA